MLHINIVNFKKITKSVSEFKCITPDIQRTIDRDHVAAIYDYQLNVYKQTGQYILAGCISIACVCSGEPTAGTEYLIDGQHRLEAYRRLNREFPDQKLMVCVDYYECHENDVEALYKNVNTHKTNGITKMDIDPYKMCLMVSAYFKGSFANYLIKSDAPRRPNINIDKIIEYIISHNIIGRAGIKSGDDFVERIKALNSFYGGLGAIQFAAWGVKTPDTLIRKISESPTNLYFGLYTNFEWLERIVDGANRPYDQIYHYSSTHRVAVTKILRNKVWNSALIDGNCYCCGDGITNTTFECGHIVPITIGGPTTFENLKPICRSCNSDMGTRNLEDYKKMITEC